MNSSDGTQYALTKALVEEKTIFIDKFLQWTYFTDYANYNHHFLSDRQLGQSIFGIPFYFIGKILLPLTNDPYNGLHPGINPDSKIQVLTILSSAVIGSGSVVIYYLFIVLKLKASKYIALLSSLIFGLGTLHWKYSSVYYRQPLSIFFLLGTLYLLINNHKNSINRYLSFLTGLFIGLVIFIDSSLIVTLPILFLYYLNTQMRFTNFRQRIIQGLIGIMLPVSINSIYTYFAFGQLFTNPYFFEVNTKFHFMKNLYTAFQTPLLPSLLVNLFSNNYPIPPSTIAPFIWENENLRNALSAYWATVHPYRGIFSQTPALFLAFIGLIIISIKRLKLFILLITTSLSIIIIQSKYSMFYSANNYDTRFFLPAVPFLILGLTSWWNFILLMKNKNIKTAIILLTIFLSLMSIYNGWYSNLTNYAPNVTGEHRFSFEQLRQPVFSSENIKENLWLLFLNTFPNIYNIHLLFIFYFPLFFVIYLFIFQRKFMIRVWKKLKTK
ncbi:hypothetical protein HY029_02125 [Candidatus Gottesmanbacteria bacterium]|nr:hypothetical protein [Candidatus Gottesmanbacteria bacterium]